MDEIRSENFGECLPKIFSKNGKFELIKECQKYFSGQENKTPSFTQILCQFIGIPCQSELERIF